MTKAAFAVAAALAAFVVALLPIPKDSDSGAAHAAVPPLPIIHG